MVKPQNILSERDRINDNVVEAVAYGALNFKPANTSTKVLDYCISSNLRLYSLINEGASLIYKTIISPNYKTIV